MDKLSWLLKKSGLVKKVTGLNYFKGDQPWAGQLQNSLPCLGPTADTDAVKTGPTIAIFSLFTRKLIDTVEPEGCTNI